jgi:hypothetical protein
LQISRAARELARARLGYYTSSARLGSVTIQARLGSTRLLYKLGSSSAKLDSARIVYRPTRNRSRDFVKFSQIFKIMFLKILRETHIDLSNTKSYSYIFSVLLQNYVVFKIIIESL